MKSACVVVFLFWTIHTKIGRIAAALAVGSVDPTRTLHTTSAAAASYAASLDAYPANLLDSLLNLTDFATPPPIAGYNGTTSEMPLSLFALGAFPKKVEVSTQLTNAEYTLDTETSRRESERFSDSNGVNRRLLGIQFLTVAPETETTSPVAKGFSATATKNVSLANTLIGFADSRTQNQTPLLDYVNNTNNNRNDTIIHATLTESFPTISPSQSKRRDADKTDNSIATLFSTAAKLVVNDSARFMMATKTTLRIDDSDYTSSSASTAKAITEPTHKQGIDGGGDIVVVAADVGDETTALANGTTWPVKHSAVMEGDVILGGLMMVHSREDSVTCGPIMPQGGVQALEVMLYTLDSINGMGLLPNITVGAHILDDCDKDTYGLEMAVDFIKGE